MEKSQFDLCIEVLRRLDRAGVLSHVVLAGSWCTLFYQDCFSNVDYAPALRTRDLDLVIPRPSKMATHTDVAELLKDLGFIVGFTGSQGYIRLEHPQLIVEFLVPERGRPSEKPFALPQLGLNAQPLRFLDYLAQNTFTTTVQEINLTIPHPAHFALHKLVVLSRRPTLEKQEKDKASAIRLLTALLDDNQAEVIKEAFQAMPRRWQTKVRQQLTAPLDAPILELLSAQ
ncbi:GSU2403 family nucleotidyltransferase fold protein [Planctomycetota bacterium]